MQLLFKTNVSKDIRFFATSADITGSRYDYEKYMNVHCTKKNPPLRAVYGPIEHRRLYFGDWANEVEHSERLFADVLLPKKIDMTKWYARKNRQIYIGMKLKQFVRNK